MISSDPTATWLYLILVAHFRLDMPVRTFLRLFFRPWSVDLFWEPKRYLNIFALILSFTVHWHSWNWYWTGYFWNDWTERHHVWWRSRCCASVSRHQIPCRERHCAQLGWHGAPLELHFLRKNEGVFAFFVHSFKLIRFGLQSSSVVNNQIAVQFSLLKVIAKLISPTSIAFSYCYHRSDHRSTRSCWRSLLRTPWRTERNWSRRCSRLISSVQPMCPSRPCLLSMLR